MATPVYEDQVINDDWEGNDGEFYGIRFLRCRLVGSVWKNSRLSTCEFDTCDLTAAEFQGAHVVSSAFLNCRLARSS